MSDEKLLKILVPLDSTFPWRSGGREGVFYYLSRELRGRVRFTFITHRWPPKKRRFYSYQDIRHWADIIPVRVLTKWTFPSPWGRVFLNTWWYGRRFESIGYRTRPYDVILALNAGVLASNTWRLSRRLGVPCVVHYHSNWPKEMRDYFPHRFFPEYLRRIEDRNLRRVDMILPVGDVIAETLRQQVHGATPIVPVYNGVDTNRFHPRAPGQPRRWPTEQVVFIANSTLRDLKGPEVPMRCLARMAPELRRQVRLVYAGRGLWAYYGRLAAELGIADQVEYLGELSPDGVAAALAQADVGMFPGNLGMADLAGLECLASGLPLVAYSYADYPALIEEDRTGYLVPLGDEAGYQRAMERMILNRERLPEMARLAYEKGRSYAWPNVADRFYQACRQAIETTKNNAISVPGGRLAPVKQKTAPAPPEVPALLAPALPPREPSPINTASPASGVANLTHSSKAPLRFICPIDSIFPWRTGGRETSRYYLSRALQGRIHFTFVTWQPRRNRPLFDGFSDIQQWADIIPVWVPGSRYWPMPWGNYLVNVAWYVTRLGQVARRTGPYDAFVVLNAGPMATLGNEIAREWAVPSIVEYRSDWPGEISGRFPYSILPEHRKQIERRNLMNADLILANGFDTAAVVAQRCEGQTQVAAICNGVDTEKFYPRLTGEPRRWPHDKVVFISNSTLRDLKGLDVPMRCLARMAPELRRHALLVFLGRGPWERYRKLAAHLGLADQVQHLGEVTHDQMAGILREADVGMFPGTFGVGTQHSALECLASGLPLVAYDFADYPALIEEGRTGYLVPMRDEAGYQAAMERLIKDRARLPEMARLCREKVDFYSWPRVADRYYEACQAVCEKLRRRSRLISR